MAQAYTPGLRVASRTLHRVRRLLPVPGDVLVKVNDQVSAAQVVARTSLPGDVTPLNLASLLSVPPVDVPECMLKKEGELVSPGEILARSKGIFGMFRSEYVSSVGGTIESISSVTGQVILRGAPLPVEVRAYLAGRVIEEMAGEGCVIETEASFIQGILGIGGETFGPIRMASKRHDEVLQPDSISGEMSGSVVVGGGRVTYEAVEKARQVGAAAVVSGGIDDEDLNQLLGYDLGLAITGSEQVGLTLIVTEGFGEIAMAERTFRLLASRESDQASVNGATQIRAGVVRPEIVIPVTETLSAQGADVGSTAQLEVGVPVRIIREPHFGSIGSVTGLPSEPQVLESGSKARVVEVQLASGEGAIIPRANIELIQD